jgi:Protein of unknown function (DUF2695)
MEQHNAEVESWDEFIESIAPDVLRCLQRRNFFERLEGNVFPEGPGSRGTCDHSYRHLISLMEAEAWPDKDHREDVFDVMRSKGGFCDCEIIYNVAPESQVREHYWKRRASELESQR